MLYRKNENLTSFSICRPGGCEKNSYHFRKASPNEHHELIVLGFSVPMIDDWNALGIKVTTLWPLHRPVFAFNQALNEAVTGEKFDYVVYWTSIRIANVLIVLSKVTETVKVHLGNASAYSFAQLLKEEFFARSLKKPSNVTMVAYSDCVRSSFIALPYFKAFPIVIQLNPAEIHLRNLKTFSSFDNPLKLDMVVRLEPIKNHPALHNHMYFEGDVKDVYGHLKKLDIFVYTTTKEEGLGSAVIEAMANGLPCILPDLPMIREIAKTNKDLMRYEADNYPDLKNNIIALSNNPLRMWEMSSRDYRHAKENFHRGDLSHIASIRHD